MGMQITRKQQFQTTSNRAINQFASRIDGWYRAGRNTNGTAIESIWRGFLSLRDPAGPTYRSVPAHAAGPPEDFHAYAQLTDAPDPLLTFSLPRGYCAQIMSAEPAIPTVPLSSATTSAHSSEPKLLNGIAPGQSPVVFFDGVCGLCNHWIDFVVARDRKRMFRFAPLQGETARDWLHADAADSLNSVVLFDASGIHRKSDAVWRILVQLGGVWRILGWSLRIVPRPVRNWGYDFVAWRRYGWFGKKETCRLTTPDERTQFLP